MNWEWVWQFAFVGVLGLFTLMSVLVTILGARDIARLIRRLRDEEDGE